MGGVAPPFSISDLIRIGAGEVREEEGGGALQINSADIKGQGVVQHVFSETD